MKQDDEVFECFKILEKMVTNKYSKRIKRFRCDNGGEYVNNVFEIYLKSE